MTLKLIWDYICMLILGIKFFKSLLLYNSLLYLGLPLYAFSYFFLVQFINTQKSEIKRMTTTEKTCKIILQSYVRSLITSRNKRVEVILSTQDNFGFKLHGFICTWLPYSFSFEAFIFKYIAELGFIPLYAFATFFSLVLDSTFYLLELNLRKIYFPIIPLTRDTLNRHWFLVKL